GPRMAPDDGRVVSNFICQALRGEALTIYGDGLQTRSLQYIDDLVESIWRLLHTDHQYPINLGNPQEVTIRDLAKAILSLIPNDAGLDWRPLPGDDPKRRCPDIHLAESVLHWRPATDLHTGLKQTIPWFHQALVPETARSSNGDFGHIPEAG
ncbi:MAG: NAD-dependent epimerase/dehydratase family protein, partial [Planctomycetota bacterium]